MDGKRNIDIETGGAFSMEPGVERIEMDLLLEAIQRKYGYDFREYSKPSLVRRIRSFVDKVGSGSISGLIPLILRDEELFSRMINGISVTVTEMFRDPEVYRVLRTEVLPSLEPIPRLNIWHAGCATGEEVYSVAIMLMEEGLYERSNIYATDLNPRSVEWARQAIYPVEQIKGGTENYRNSGGTQAFSNYYHARYGKAKLDDNLKRNITFSTHNLAGDRAFNTMHMIFCRNVLIYFDRPLQNRVLKLLSESLHYHGILCLGNKEDIRFSEIDEDFVAISSKYRIYRKKGYQDFGSRP